MNRTGPEWAGPLALYVTQHSETKPVFASSLVRTSSRWAVVWALAGGSSTCTHPTMPYAGLRASIAHVTGVPVSTDTMTTAGLVLAAVVLLVTLVAAMLGGAVGRHYHARVDKAAW